MKDATPGLDMRPTLEWYAENAGDLLAILPQASFRGKSFPVRNPRFIHLTAAEVRNTVRLYPLEALSRSRLNTGAIIGAPTLYFKAGSEGGNIQVTPNPTEALSPTAIIPSYTDNSRWQQTGIASSDVYLYQLPASISPEVRRIVQMQGLLHEIAHTIISQALYQEGYTLRLPTGEVVNGLDFILKQFAKPAEEYPPISHYSSFYRKDGSEFSSKLTIDEELAEVLAARMIGFVFGPNLNTRFSPFRDRPRLIPFINNFLHAVEEAV